MYRAYGTGRDSLLITDTYRPVTSTEVKSAIKWALSGLPANKYKGTAIDYSKFKPTTPINVIVFFAGHGSSVVDVSGDELDGRDEVIITSDGYILDDDIRRILHDMSTPNTTAKFIFDCCSSGTVCDLGFVCSLPNSRLVVTRERKISPAKRPSGKIVCISACNDGSVTYENQVGGLFTTSVLQCKGLASTVEQLVTMLKAKGHDARVSTNCNPMNGKLVIDV